MSVAIVIPTIREENINQFLDKWTFPFSCSLFVIEDNPHKKFKLSKKVYFHGSWEDFKNIKGNWIFPKRCGGGIRSFGFHKAWQEDFDYYISLDDDCFPSELTDGKEFIQRHINQLERNDGKWKWTTKMIKSRGVPYFNLGQEQETLINVGFWRKNADLDAPTQLVIGNVDLEPEMFDPVPKDYYIPMCSMNFSFKHRVVPLMFFPPMGEKFGIWRFDDIWCGIIVKKICDHLGYLVRCGTPEIEHSRASNLWINLKREGVGMEMNENFWQTVDDIRLKGKTVGICYGEIAETLKREKGYLKILGEAMLVWLSLFD